METSYGEKREGKSHFVVVAPHGAMHDDDYTGELADRVAELLDAYAVVNTEYAKPSNPNAKPDYSNVENFNRLAWTGKRYSWKKKKPAMKDFYDDITAFCDEARANCQYGRAVIVYIHGMTDGDDNMGIDIGCGARYHKGELKGAHGLNTKHPSAGSNTGVIRALREHMLLLQEALESKFLDAGHNYRAGIGDAKRANKNGRILRFAAWSRWNGVQYHAGTDDVSFQLEVNRTLRNDIPKTAKIIADSLYEVYKDNLTS